MARAHRIVHGGVPDCYRVPPGASAEMKVTVAQRLLSSGQAGPARRLLDEALDACPGSGRVWFHWLLALFSGRTVPELAMRERERLFSAREETGRLLPSAWTPGIEAILELAEGAGRHGGAAALLAGLGDGMRAEIEEHLERVLYARLRDECWRRGVDRAARGRAARSREARAWMFFEPDPAPPRIRPPRPAGVSAGLRVLAGLSGALAVAGAGTIGWLLVPGRQTSALLALVIGLGGAGVALAGGAEWRFRAGRARRGARRPRPLGGTAPAGSFAEQVDRLYAHYARRYAGQEHAWFGAAYAQLCDLRDELVAAYADPEPCWREVRWLIRFQVRDLLDRRDEPRPAGPSRELRTITVLGALLGAAGLARAAQEAAWPLLAVLPAAAVATVALLRIVAEHRRAAADAAEHDRRLTTYLFEFQRWQHVLGARPDDLAMARWLDCDRRLLIDRALHDDGLTWSDVQVCTTVTEPSPGSVAARVAHGPWRWSRCELQIFLLTADGVHRIAAELDLARAVRHDHDRAAPREHDRRP